MHQCEKVTVVCIGRKHEDMSCILALAIVCAGRAEVARLAMSTMSPEKYVEDYDNCGALEPGMQAKIADNKGGS